MPFDPDAKTQPMPKTADEAIAAMTDIQEYESNACSLNDAGGIDYAELRRRLDIVKSAKSRLRSKWRDELDAHKIASDSYRNACMFIEYLMVQEVVDETTGVRILDKTDEFRAYVYEMAMRLRKALPQS